MKIFLILCLFFISAFAANKQPILKEILTFHSHDETINTANIKTFDNAFVKIDNNSTFKEIESCSYWFKLTLRDDLKSGRYIVSYRFSDFDMDTFAAAQTLEKFTLLGKRLASFSYKRGRDPLIYYVRVTAIPKHYSRYLRISSMEDYYTWLNGYIAYLMIAGLILGLIMMTAIYNAALYYKTGEKSFLYYALMQFFMVSVLFFHTGMSHAISPHLTLNSYIYEYLELLTALFGVLFTRAFLDTQKFLPYHDKLLQLFLVVIMIDMLFYIKPILADFKLYSLTTAYFLVVGYLRMRQGFAPARFFLIGWSALMLGILIVEYFAAYAYFDTMMLGSGIEAIMLAIALAYKIKLLQDEKEQQKELLIHQSKLAAMGEMLGNIAHQWRQPLTHLSYILMNIEALDEQEARKKKVAEGTTQLEFMSQTIDDFRDFFAPQKEKETFLLSQQLQHILSLLTLSPIKVDIEILKEETIHNYKNECKQALLNIITNAKEVLLEREIKNPLIMIKIEKHTIMIEDNAGGLQGISAQKIFEPYFSTKEKSSGIGLYMSKLIIEKNMGGELRVEEGENGLRFICRV